MRKRVLSIVLALCMLLTLAPVTGAAEDEIQVNLLDGPITVSEADGIVTVVQGQKNLQGTKVTVESGNMLSIFETANTITVTGGTVPMTLYGMHIKSDDAPIDIKRGATLQLTLPSMEEISPSGEVTVRMMSSVTALGETAGIHVPAGASLELIGRLNAVGGENCAGIGGNDGEDAGTITLNSSELYVESGAFAAAIGGGRGGSGGTVAVDRYSELTGSGYYHFIGGGAPGNEYGCTDLVIEDQTKVTASVIADDGTLFEERFYNNTVDTDSACVFLRGKLLALARSGEARGSLYDEPYKWLWQESMDGVSGWTDLTAYDECDLSRDADESRFYRCVITNEFGNTIISPVGQILPIKITQQPEDVTANKGEVVEFVVETNYNDHVGWLWEQRLNEGEWTRIAGATEKVLTVTADEDGWQYRCLLYDCYDDVVYTNPASLTLGNGEDGGADTEDPYANTFFIGPDASPETVVTEYAISEGYNFFYYDNLNKGDEDARFDKEDIGAENIFYYDAACTQPVSTDVISLVDELERGALAVMLRDPVHFPADGVYMAARKDDGTVVKTLHLTLFPVAGTATAPRGLSYRLLDANGAPTGNYLANPLDIPTTAGQELALYFNGEPVVDADLLELGDTARLKPLWDDDEEDPTGCYRLVFEDITNDFNTEICYNISKTSQIGRSGRAITAVPVRPAYGFYTDSDPSKDYSSLVEEIEVPEGGKKTVYLYSEDPAGSVTIQLDGEIIASGALSYPYRITIDADDILAKGSHLIAQAPGVLPAELEIYLEKEEETLADGFYNEDDDRIEEFAVSDGSGAYEVCYKGDALEDIDSVKFVDGKGNDISADVIKATKWVDRTGTLTFKVLETDDFPASGVYLIVIDADGEECARLEIVIEEEASGDIAPADTLCWRGIEKCGGNVYEPTGAYSTEPITVHGTNTRRVVFYYDGVMLEPDELTFSEHSGLTIEEIAGENEDGEAFTHFRILSKNGVGFTDQTAAYKKQTITINFEAVNRIPDGLCYSIAGVSTDENGDEYYVDGTYRTTEISIPSVNSVNIRVYYDGELIEREREIEWSDGLTVKTRKNDDGTFGCFNISFADITEDEVQSFACEEDTDDIIEVRPNLAPYGFYVKSMPELRYVTQKLALTVGDSATIYFCDLTEGDSGTPEVAFKDEPKGITLTAGAALANGMVPYTITVEPTAKAGKYTLMATGDVDWDFAELMLTVESLPEIVVHPLADAPLVSGEATFRASGTCKGSTLTYQWQKLENGEWVDMDGETASTLTTTNWNTGTYRCALTNAYGNTAYTNDATTISTTQATVVDLANGPISVRSDGYNSGAMIYATQNGKSYNGGAGWTLVVIQSTETTANTITVTDGRVKMLAVGLNIETETGPAINVTRGQLSMTLNGKNVFTAEEGPAIRVTRDSVTGDYINRSVTIYGEENTELIVETQSDTASAIGGNEGEMAGSVTLSGVKGEVNGGLYAIGGGDESAVYGCYSLSISNCPDLDLSGRKKDVVLQTRMQANSPSDQAKWNGGLSVTMAYPVSGCTYQWERSSDGKTWEEIQDGAASSIILDPAYSGWYYRCVVTNSYGNTLTVDAGQVYRFMVTEQPAAAMVADSTEVSFTAKTNVESKHWQWQVSTDGGVSWSNVGTKQTGGTVSMLTLTAEEAMNGNLYRCEIADEINAYGYTEAAALTIGTPPSGLPYTLDSIILRDPSTNAVLNAIPSGDFLAELTFTNVSADAGATFLLVTYDADGRMLDLDYCIAFPDAGKTMTWGALVKNGGSAARIQAMALSSLGELIPMAESLVYPAAQ